MVRDLVAASDDNFRETWRRLGQRTHGITEDDDLLMVETGAIIPTFNPVFVKRVPADAEALVRRAVDRPVAGTLIVNPSVGGIDRLLDAAVACGLTRADPMPGMALATIDRLRPAPEELEIREPDSGRDWETYFRVLCERFGIALELVAPLTDPHIYDQPGMRAFLGYAGGEAVATALACETDGIAGVYNIATLPSFRGRGYGAAMSGHAAAWGRDRGAEVAVLQASAMGRPVYERMGFVEVVAYVQLVMPT